MEQKLIDALFEMVLTAATHEWFKDKTQEEIATWVRLQLSTLGIDVIPMGASHGILIKE